MSSRFLLWAITTALSLTPATGRAQTLGGRVLDATSHQPVAGVQVRLRRAAPPGLPALVFSARTDSTGTFYAQVPLAGRYAVSFRRPGSAPSASIDAVIGPDDFVQSDFLVAVTAPAADTVYDDEDVDAPVSSARGSAPAYPSGPQSRGEEASFRVSFVVDTAGRAELATLQFLEYAPPDFREAVRSWLRAAHFQPALIGETAVRVRVVQGLEFRMGRRDPAA